MLIPGDTIIDELRAYGRCVQGVLHVGAHDCEEMPFYNSLGIPAENIIWIDALQNKVNEAKARGIPNVFQAIITDKDDQSVTFHVSNNIQSSSIFDFGTHAQYYPGIRYTNTIQTTTTTLDTFFTKHGLDPSVYDFWNFDIQGAEMLALQGATNALKHAYALYLEVNVEEVYKGCARLHELDKFLYENGFVRIKTEITGMGWGDALYLKLHP